MARKRHISARGREVNFDELFLNNKKTIAVTGGGAPMNASGDLLGPGGKIIQTVEERDRVSNPQPVVEGTPYTEDNPNAVKQVSVKDNIDDLTAAMSTPKAKPLSIDDAANAKSPQEVMMNLNQQIEDANKAVNKDDVKMTVEPSKTKIKNKRKIIDSDK